MSKWSMKATQKSEARMGHMDNTNQIGNNPESVRQRYHYNSTEHMDNFKVMPTPPQGD